MWPFLRALLLTFFPPSFLLPGNNPPLALLPPPPKSNSEKSTSANSSTTSKTDRKCQNDSKSQSSQKGTRVTTRQRGGTDPRRIPPALREEVWQQYFGKNEEGKCYCCDRLIYRQRCGWHCSHVVAYQKGGVHSVSNLRPCCPGCNLSMGNQNLYAYIVEHDLRGAGRRHYRSYFSLHPEQRNDRRTNNYGQKK